MSNTQTTYPEYGQAVKKQRLDKILSSKRVVDRLYRVWKQDYKKANHHLSEIEKGAIFGATSGLTITNPKNLERLSVLLYVLDFDKSDQMIQGIDGICRKAGYESGFQYPPKIPNLPAKF